MTLEIVRKNTPNKHLISNLERLLESAKSGELISFLSVTVWKGNGTSHGWSAGPQSSFRSLLSELTIAQHEFLTMLSMSRNDSVIREALDQKLDK